MFAGLMIAPWFMNKKYELWTSKDSILKKILFSNFNRTLFHVDFTPEYPFSNESKILK